MGEQVIRKRKVRKKKSKKKSYKKLWVTLGILALVVALTASGLVYYFFLRDYEVSDSKVTEIVRAAYSIELPDGTIIKFDEEGKVLETIPGKAQSSSTELTQDTTLGVEEEEQVVEEEEQGTVGAEVVVGQVGPSASSSVQTQENGETFEGTGSSSSESGNQTPSRNESASGESAEPSTSPSTENSVGTVKPTVADIKRKYDASFSSLEAQANGKLNSLLSRAKAEFEEKQRAGEEISYGYFYNKYSPAANRLEINTDTVFNSLLAVVQEDLKKHGYSPGYADSFKAEYQQRKEARRASILNQVR